MRAVLLLALAASGVVPTELGRLAVAPADVVVLARVESVGNAGARAAIARLVVDEVLAGEALVEASLLCYPGEFREGDRELLFLTRTRSGARFEILRRLSANDPDFAQKVAVSRRTIALARAGDVVAATLAALVDWVEQGPAWTRTYALRELHALAPDHAAAVDAALWARLSALAARPVAAWLPPAGELPSRAPDATDGAGASAGRGAPGDPHGAAGAPPGGFAWEPLGPLEPFEPGTSPQDRAIPAPAPAPGDVRAAAPDPGLRAPAPSRDEAAHAAAEDVANSLRRLLETLQSHSSSLPAPASREQSPR